MFEDVAQMEKEIDTFRKNVVASSQLVEGIAELTEATKKHTEAYSLSTAELLKKMDACIVEIEADHESALRTLSTNNDTAISTLQRNIAAELQSRMVELQQIKTTLESCSAETTRKSDKQIGQLITECERLLAEMKKTQGSQNSFYSESTAEVLKKMDAFIVEIKADHESALRTLSTNNDTAISTLQRNIAAELQARMVELQQIKTALADEFLFLMAYYNSDEEDADCSEENPSEETELGEETETVVSEEETSYEEDVDMDPADEIIVESETVITEESEVLPGE